MNKVDRATKTLERIKSKTGMSEDGMNWLIAVLDPQHDERLLCDGYPDRQTGPSVLQVIKSSYDLAIPATYTAGSTWGFHIYMDDYLCNDIYLSGAGQQVENQNIHTDQTVTPTGILQVGGLSCVAWNQTITLGNEILILPPVAGGNKNASLLGVAGGQPTNLQTAFLQGKSRKIAEAFEVANTTAELYRGGSVLVYEQPCSKNDACATFVQLATATLDPEIIRKYGKENIFIEEPKLIVEEEHLEEKALTLALESKEERMKHVEVKREDRYLPKRYYVLECGKKVYLDKHTTPVVRNGVTTSAYDVLKPRTLAEAMLLPGTIQWEAAKGCYCVQTMDDMNNPPTFPNTMTSVYTQNELVWPTAGNSLDFSSNAFVPTFSADVTQVNVCGTNNFKGPWNSKGAVFSGLTPQSTFKVNRTVVVERFISSQDGNLAVLAKMSPCEDYIALGFYSEIIKHMPVGCRFSDNGLGDWFMGIADGVADFVTGLAKPVLGAAEGWKGARQGGSPVPSSAPKLKGPTPKRSVKAAGGRMKKNNAIQYGPRNKNGSFQGPAGKAVRGEKKKIKKQVKKEIKKDVSNIVNGVNQFG